MVDRVLTHRPSRGWSRCSRQLGFSSKRMIKNKNCTFFSLQTDLTRLCSLDCTKYNHKLFSIGHQTVRSSLVGGYDIDKGI